MPEIQFMSVTYDEMDSGAPALCFCMELSIAISNKTLAKSFVHYYENDMAFKLGSLSGNRFSFKWYDEDKGILEVHFKNIFMGYVLSGELYNAFVKVYKTLLEQSSGE